MRDASRGRDDIGASQPTHAVRQSVDIGARDGMTVNGGWWTGVRLLDERAEVGEAARHGATDELGRTGVKSRLVLNAASATGYAIAGDVLAAGAAR